MPGKEQRHVWPVIQTDRVVTPGASLTREWALTDTLYTHRLPVGFGGITRPVIVIANRLQHLQQLVHMGIALALMSEVDPADFDTGRMDHRALQAHESRRLLRYAEDELLRAWVGEVLDPLVATHALARLRAAVTPRESFSKRWEVAAPLFATMTLTNTRCLETGMVKAMFNVPGRSADSVRQDQSRARKFMDKIVNGKNLEVDDQPSRVNSKTLTEKYLQAVLPLLLPGQPVPGSFELFDTSTVTARGGRVTCDA